MEPYLSSQRLYYRPFVDSDLDLLKSLLMRSEVCQFLPGEKAYTALQVEKTLDYFIKTHHPKNQQAIFKVFLKCNDAFIGYAGLQLVKEFNKTEVFYAFLPDHWQKGYASEAGREMIRYAEELDIDELIALADTRNIGSNKVLTNIGFKQHGQVDLWGLKLNFYEFSFERTF